MRKTVKYNKRKQPSLLENAVIVLLIIFTLELSFPHLAVAHNEVIKGNDKKVIQVQVKGYFWSEEQLRTNVSFISRANALELSPRAEPPKPKVKKTVWVPVTAYSSTPDQTDGSPYRTASMTYVRDGVVAANFLWIGTRVRFPDYSGDKIYVIEDRMNARYHHRADIWMPTREQAKQFGFKYLKMEIL